MMTAPREERMRKESLTYEDVLRIVERKLKHATV